MAINGKETGAFGEGGDLADGRLIEARVFLGSPLFARDVNQLIATPAIIGVTDDGVGPLPPYPSLLPNHQVACINLDNYGEIAATLNGLLQVVPASFDTIHHTENPFHWNITGSGGVLGPYYALHTGNYANVRHGKFKVKGPLQGVATYHAVSNASFATPIQFNIYSVPTLIVPINLSATDSYEFVPDAPPNSDNSGTAVIVWIQIAASDLPAFPATFGDLQAAVGPFWNPI